MKIFPEMTRNAWKVLLSLIHEPKAPSEIAKENNMELSRVSEALRQLERARIIKIRKRKKLRDIETSLKNLLRALLSKYSKERLIDCLEGKKLNILILISGEYDKVKKLKFVSGYSAITINRALKRLQDCLFIFQPKRGTYRIRSEFEPLINQLNNSFYAHFLDLLDVKGIRWKEVNTYGNIILIRSTQKRIPEFVPTGFSVFHKYGIEIIETSDNYFVNSKKNPNKEEVFVHALVFSLMHRRDMMFCMLFADLNILKLEKMKEIVMVYKVKEEVDAIFEFLKTKGKIRFEFFPTWEEYIKVRRDYERS